MIFKTLFIGQVWRMKIMCKCIDWLVYSFEYSVNQFSPDNPSTPKGYARTSKGGARTRMLNSMMPLKDILRMCKEASEVCEPCREKE